MQFYINELLRKQKKISTIEALTSSFSGFFSEQYTYFFIVNNTFIHKNQNGFIVKFENVKYIK